MVKALFTAKGTGHNLSIASLVPRERSNETASFILICTTCGKYVSKRCDGLRTGCHKKEETRSTWMKRMCCDYLHPLNNDLLVDKLWHTRQ